MRILDKVLMGIVLASMIFIAASCCCTGGLDDDNIDLNLPGEHNEGTGGDA
jgi:hypothetical protein